MKLTCDFGVLAAQGSLYLTLLIELLTGSLEQAKQDVFILATLGLFVFKLAADLSDHVLKHVYNLVLAVTARLTLSLDRLRHTVLLLLYFGLGLEVTLLSLHDFEFNLVVQFREVILEASFEILKSVIARLRLFAKLVTQRNETIRDGLRNAPFHVNISLALLSETLSNLSLHRR